MARRRRPAILRPLVAPPAPRPVSPVQALLGQGRPAAAPGRAPAGFSVVPSQRRAPLPPGGFRAALQGPRQALPPGGFRAAINPAAAPLTVPERYGPFPQMVRRVVPPRYVAPTAGRLPVGRRLPPAPASAAGPAAPSPSRAPARGTTPPPAATGTPTRVTPGGAAVHAATPDTGQPLGPAERRRVAARLNRDDAAARRRDAARNQPTPGAGNVLPPPPAPAPAAAAPAAPVDDRYAGLPDWAVADLKAFDAATQAQSSMIPQAYTNLANLSGQDADAAARRLGTLASLAAGSYQPNVPSAGAPGPYGTVAAPDQPAAVANLPGALSDAQRQQLLAQTALSVNTANALPTLARAAGQTALQTYQAQRQGDRNTYLQNARQTVLEQAQHAADQALQESQFSRQLASTEEGRNLELLSPFITQLAKGGGGTATKQTGVIGPFPAGSQPPEGYSAVDNGDGTVSFLRQPAAKGGKGISVKGLVGPIAPGSPMPKGAIPQVGADGQLYYSLPKAGAGKGGAKASDMRQWVKFAQSLHDGVNRRTETMPDGTKVPVADVYEPEEIFPRLIAQGASPRQAYSIVTSVTQKNINAQNIWNGLRQNGIPAQQAYAIIKRLAPPGVEQWMARQYSASGLT